jgi:5-methylcytosine-specific restriction endonuclease McrA
MKQCFRCGESKMLDAFRRDKKQPDGYAISCKSCMRTYNRDRFAQMSDAQKESERARWRDRYAENDTFREQHKEKNKERFRTNPNKRATEPAEQNIARNRIWRALNPFKGRMYRSKRRARMNDNGGDYTEQQWLDLCDRYGNVCLCCRAAKPLTVDHVIPISKGGANSIDNIQPLCSTCNTRKKTKSIDYRY